MSLARNRLSSGNDYMHNMQYMNNTVDDGPLEQLCSLKFLCVLGSLHAAADIGLRRRWLIKGRVRVAEREIMMSE
eukprot:scaffold351219_cov14-Prasinocladus_malaysianus.AAC.1